MTRLIALACIIVLSIITLARSEPKVPKIFAIRDKSLRVPTAVDMMQIEFKGSVVKPEKLTLAELSVNSDDRVFFVQANKGWQRTRIWLNKGETVHIEANPKDSWWISPGTKWIDANGIDMRAGGDRLAPDERYGSLIARVATDDQWMNFGEFIGLKGNYQTSEMSGYLELSANDDYYKSKDWRGFDDNQGTIKVRIFPPPK